VREGKLQTPPIDLPPLQGLDIDVLKHAHIECFYAVVKPGLDALGHEGGAAAAAEVVLDALFAEAVFLFDVSTSMQARLIRRLRWGQLSWGYG
jgi:hypothetical protein